MKNLVTKIYHSICVLLNNFFVSIIIVMYLPKTIYKYCNNFIRIFKNETIGDVLKIENDFKESCFIHEIEKTGSRLNALKNMISRCNWQIIGSNMLY